VAYEVIVEADAEKTLAKLQRKDAERVYKKLLALAENPRPHGALKSKDKGVDRVAF
jgi:mRNA-degrading endonuclease RelE of RelBE toxin-antitoxin system